MKYFTLLLLAAITSSIAFSQNSNLVFYSQDGERFHVILNGIKQNAKAETNVKVTGLNQPYYKAKIIFDDVALGEVSKTINFNPGNETVIAIKKNKKNMYVMRWQSEVPMAQAPPPAPSQTVIVYSSTPPPEPVATGISITETTTTTTVTEGAAPTGEQVNVSVGTNEGTGGVNMNIRMNVSGTGATTGTTTTYSTTTTTTSTDYAESPPAALPEVYILPGYNGPTGCDWPMNDGGFASARQSISSKSFEDSKMTIAKQIIGSNCLLCDQVKEIMLLFDFEDSKLEFAKYAYGYTFDQGNFYKLNDAFEFESTIDELNEYINNR